MAFISSLVAAATTFGTFLASSTVGALLARTAITALVSYALNRTIAKGQARTGVDPGARQMLSPATNHKIPVIYGTAYMGGAITDAQLVNDNKTMWVCLAISERTGPLFSTGAASAYTFNECYRNADQVFFETDGVTVARTQDADSNVDESMKGLVKIYMYAGSGDSANQIAPAADIVVGSVAPTLSAVNAWDIFPDWTPPGGLTPNTNMSDLVFALIRVDYNRDKNVTAIGDYQFSLTNSMSLQGDVIFDYATNTRYGAGIRLSEIATGEPKNTTIARLGLNDYDWIDLT
jgi:hypothetical protein